MTGTVKEIIEAKERVGEGAYLWLAYDGIAILWACEEDSHTTDPLQRWELDSTEKDQLIETGLVDDQGVLGCSGENYEKVESICAKMLSENSPTDPTLFKRIIHQLVNAGITIDHIATAKARAETPNVVAVFKGGDSDEETPEDWDYIEVLGGEAIIWGYDGGDFQAQLLTAEQISHYYEDPQVTVADLEGLRYLERKGVRLYDEADITVISERMKAERQARMDAARNLSMVLPDEFLKLCEEVHETPAAILEGFIADLCHLQESPYITNGSDERDMAEAYFDRCGYRVRVEWERERLKAEADKKS